MKSIHLWQEDIATENGFTTVQTMLEGISQDPVALWFRLPSEYADRITQSCDPFVVAVLFMAMYYGTNLVVHGEVSPSLLSNLDEFQAAWSSWHPQRYRQITIHAALEQGQSRDPGEAFAISAFSGGVDSCFTAFRHRKGRCGRVQRNLKTGLMVHGFDIPLHSSDMFERAAKRSRVMLSSLGMELLPIATNYRQICPVQWEDTFGTAIAACLMLFQKYYTAGLVPASLSYQPIHDAPHGSNSITDPLLSSSSFRIIPDGAVGNRVDKLREIGSWTECLENLRVCWEGSNKDRNCGQCEKCIRTVLSGRIAGIYSPPCFDQEVSNQAIADLRVHGEFPLKQLKFLLELARSAQIEESWVAALEQCIRRNQKQPRRFSAFKSLLFKRLQPYIPSINAQ